MSQHTSPPRLATITHRPLPRGRGRLIAFDVALDLAGALQSLVMPRGLSHLRDHLVRAADNTALRLSEASGRTLGNRYQHLEGAYAENQEVQSDLLLMEARGVEVPAQVLHLSLIHI